MIECTVRIAASIILKTKYYCVPFVLPEGLRGFVIADPELSRTRR